MVKIKRNPKPAPTDIDGCTLIPLDKRQDGWPKTQPGILPNTYYRIDNKTGNLRCMVTVMPTGLRLAWDMCGKCHDTVARCLCRSGVYHGSSIGFIRATYDHSDWPGVKITDYSEYYDPFGRKHGEGVDRSDVTIWQRGPLADPKPPTTRTEARRAKQKVAKDIRDQVSPVSGGLTVRDIENIDMAEVQKSAEAQVAEQTKAVRRIIRRKKA